MVSNGPVLGADQHPGIDVDGRQIVPSSWLMSWPFAAWTVGSALAIYVLLTALSRLIGPRSFSQMPAFDFAVTVALGAIVGSTAAGAVGLPAGLLALTSLFTFRGTVADSTGWWTTAR